jgi:ornithine cyclodeaminase/alanine dehydrogenase-like protein (mu-crystallin family)
VRYLDGAAVRAAIPTADAIAALRTGLAEGAPPQPVRTSTDWTGGELLVMPAEAGPVAGVKLVTVGHGPVRVQGVYVLFDAATLTPLVVADAVALTLIRTAALSALATDLLAPPDASRLAVIGTGPQAREHVAAIRAVRPITSVTVVGRTPAKAAAFAASVGATAGSDVSGAEIVCCCTTSATPVVDAAGLADRAHVNAIGAHLPDHREVAGDVVASSFVVVDDVEAARREAGDLIMAVAEGAADKSVFDVDLAMLVRGVATPPEARTLFKSVGFGLADLLVARVGITPIARG